MDFGDRSNDIAFSANNDKEAQDKVFNVKGVSKDYVLYKVLPSEYDAEEIRVRGYERRL
jgi:hypothetical protein